MINKILGYSLLVAGLAVIIFTAFQSYNIYTGKTSAPLVFKVPAPQEVSSEANPTLQQQIEQNVQKQIGQILPVSTIIKALNLAMWSFFAFILIYIGGTIANIGVKLVISEKKQAG